MCPRWPSPSSRCSSSGRCPRCWRERPGRCAHRGRRSCCGSRSRWPPCSPRSARESRSPAGSSSPAPTGARPPPSPARSPRSAGRCGSLYVVVFALTLVVGARLVVVGAPGGDRHPAPTGPPPDAGRPARHLARLDPRGVYQGERPAHPRRRPAAGLLPARRAQPRRGQRGHAHHPVRRRDLGDPQPRAGPPARPSRPRAGDVHRGARRVPTLRPQRQRAGRGAAAHRAARRRRRRARRRPHVPWPAHWSRAPRVARPRVRWPRVARPRCCGCAGSAGGPTAWRLRRRRTSPRPRCSSCRPSRWRYRGSPNSSGCSPHSASPRKTFQSPKTECHNHNRKASHELV